MSQSDFIQAFRPDTLSSRERQVLDMAIEGLTDDGIAHALELSKSTVNSYWVRIRGKLGQYSRTEIVSRLLRAQAENAQSDLVAQVERLTQDLADSQSFLSELRSDLDAERGVGWHLPALQALPEGVIVAKFPGVVVYVNREAERLFGREASAMVGREVCELTIPESHENERHHIRRFMEARVTGRLTVGIDEPCFAKGCEEKEFRATIAIQGFTTPEGFMAAFAVRELLGDMDGVLLSLRRLHAAT